MHQPWSRTCVREFTHAWLFIKNLCFLLIVWWLSIRNSNQLTNCIRQSEVKFLNIPPNYQATIALFRCFRITISWKAKVKMVYCSDNHSNFIIQTLHVSSFLRRGTRQENYMSCLAVKSSFPFIIPLCTYSLNSSTISEWQSVAKNAIALISNTNGSHHRTCVGPSFQLSCTYQWCSSFT